MGRKESIMAKSGSFSGTLSGRYANHYTVRIDWSAEQSVTNNQTTITCKMYFVHDWGIAIGARTHSVTIAGTAYSLSSSRINEETKSTYCEHYIGSCSKTITHNPDGTHPNVALSAVLSFKATLNETYYFDSINASTTIAIDTIPRTSKPTLSASSGYMGNSIIVFTNSKSSAYNHFIYYDAGDGWVSIASNISNNYTWTVPTELINKVTIGKSLAVTIWLETWNGGSYLGKESTLFTAYVPENSTTKPTLTFVATSPSAPATWVTTPYVQGKSQVKATITGSGKLGATISSYAMTVNGVTKTSTSNAITSDILQKSGTVAVKCKVTDSRTIPSDEVSSNIIVIPYGKPILSPYGANGAIICARCDSTGELSNTGTSLKLSVRAKWFSLANKENTATLQVRYVTGTTDSGWKTQTATASGGGSANNYISWYDFNGIASGVTLDVSKEYTVYVRCTDRFGLYEDIPYPIPSQEVCFHLREGGKGAAFGEYATEENVLSLDEKWILKVKGALAVFLADGKTMPTIVETGSVEGTSDFQNTQDIIWHYRKWSDGTAECWGSCKCANVYCDTPWGAMYETSSGFGKINYPFAFAERPMLLLSISKSEAGLMIEYPQREHSVNEVNTGLWWFARPNTQAGASDAHMDIYVRGKWK
jgi:hypothetical protein